MPLYEYKCRSCGETFEVIQKFSDTPLKVHEKCGGPVDRLVSPSALRFKGSGWYVNDYGGGSGNGKNNESKDSKDSKADSKDSKKESKKESSSSATEATSTKPETKSPSATPSSSDKKG